MTGGTGGTSVAEKKDADKSGGFQKISRKIWYKGGTGRRKNPSEQAKELIGMKKWSLFLGLYLCVCLLAACSMTAAPTEQLPEEPTEELPKAMDIFRVVGDAEGFLLAKQDGGAGEIFTLPEDWARGFRGGELVEVTWSGAVQETYPGRLVDITEIQELDYGFDDLSGLYLTVLEDLWEVDKGLNESGVDYVGVDLSETSLSESERAAVSHLFAGRHGAEAVSGTWNELVERGDIAAEPLSSTGSGTDEPTGYFYYWDNGCHFTIQEKPVTGSYSLKPIAFDAQKWRSSLGAYFFGNCTSVQSALGEWGGYQIGSEMIS